MYKSEKLAIQTFSDGKAFHVLLCCGPLSFVLLFSFFAVTKFWNRILAAFKFDVAAVSQNFVPLL